MALNTLAEHVTVVIPCYNAGERLARVVNRARMYVNRILVVDDGSTDGAPQTVSSHDARVISLPGNRGKGFALLEGFTAALESTSTACVAVIDADGQHDPAELPTLYQAFLEHQADLVIGARRFDLAHVPWRSRFGNVVTATVVRLLLHQALPDTQSGFRLHSRRLLEHVVKSVAGGRYETETEILVRAVLEGYRVISVPIQTLYEAGNPSSHFHRFRDSWRIYVRLLRAVRAAKTGSR